MDTGAYLSEQTMRGRIVPENEISTPWAIGTLADGSLEALLARTSALAGILCLGGAVAGVGVMIAAFIA